MKKAIWFLGLAISLRAAEAVSLPTTFSLEDFRRAIVEPSSSLRAPVPVRQADAGFIVQKNWVEKDSNGKFIGKMERICSQRFKVNVYDVRDTQWSYPSMTALATCSTNLDSRDGLLTYTMMIDLGGFVYLNRNQENREMKNFAPWAYVRSDSGSPQWPMNTVITTPALDLQEIAFTFGGQHETFFQDQTISVTASFTDK